MEHGPVPGDHEDDDDPFTGEEDAGPGNEEEWPREEPEPEPLEEGTEEEIEKLLGSQSVELDSAGMEENVTLRHEGFYDDPEWREKMSAGEPLKQWIAEKLLL